VFFGTFDGAQHEGRRKAVEAAIVRTLIRSGHGGALTNTQVKGPFKTLPRGVDITKLLPEALQQKLIRSKTKVPEYDAGSNHLKIGYPATFELALE
jgi:hypothetical protein